MAVPESKFLSECPFARGDDRLGRRLALGLFLNEMVDFDEEILRPKFSM